MSLPGPLSVFINASAVSLACFVLNAQTGSIALSPFQMVSPSGSSWLLFPLCSALLWHFTHWSSFLLSNLFSYLLSALTIWFCRGSSDGRAMNSSVSVRRGWALPCACSTFSSPAVALLRSSCCLPCLHRGSWVLQDPLCTPRLCSSLVVIPASLCWVQCPALSGCTEILGNASSWWMFCATNTPPGRHSMPLPLCQGWGTAGFQGFSYSWLLRPCVTEELQCHKACQ